MDNDKIKEFIAASGAMAETLFIFYSQLINVGFNHDDAIELSKTMIETLIRRDQ